MNDPFLKPMARIVPETDWFLIVALLAILLFITSRILFPRYHNRLRHAFFNQYEAEKLIAEKTSLFSRGGILLNMVTVICIATIVYQQIGVFNPEYLLSNPLPDFLVILALTLAYFAFRILSIQMIGHFFESREPALRFNQIWLLQFENLGILLLLPALAVPFASGIVKIILLVILWVLLILWLLYMISRELGILKSFHISIFYMFLYLCTLEILPLWWVIQSITEGW